ncbi:cadmium-exporting ATPase [Mycoplasma sp. CAG:776]|nr:cadmium-exporting ATPase [Mycoplasma sp. CAG:776]
MLKNYRYYLQNLDCANCAKKIENEIKKDKRFREVIINFSTLTLSFQSNMSNPFPEILKIIKRIEPDVLVYVDQSGEQIKDYELFRFILALIVLGVSFLISNMILKEIFIAISYLLLLYKTFIKAVKKVVKSHNVDENALICISAVGAYILGEHMEGLMVLLLYVLGKILEEKAVNKSRSSIKDLVELKTSYANLKVNKAIRKVKSEDLKIDDVIVVKKGELIPVDGIILKGKTMVDTSGITGESELREVKEKEVVLSGYINKGEVTQVKVTHTYFDSMAYKILELTLNATNNKAKTETFVSKIAGYYTPIVLLIAVLVGVFLPLVSSISYNESIYRALTFLVISCPCAIAISVPLSYFAGIGISSKKKVLVKGSNYLDILTKCDVVVFDKTGTLTTGALKLENIHIYNKDYTQDEILKLASLGEAFSNHPIAQLILRENKQKLDTSGVKDFKEIEGKGIEFQYHKDLIRVGSASFCHTKLKDNLFVEVNGEVIGGFVFNDHIKENAQDVIKKMKDYQIKTYMFTGDHDSFAHMVAENVGIDEYQAELLPNEKFARLTDLQKTHTVMFVGDGINDAPSLVQADIGVSMGYVGSNSAIEASDIVIMNDDLECIPTMFGIAHKTKKIIMMNLIFSIGIKLVILVLAMLGIAHMALAVFADTGVTLLAILNSLRILKQ